jgi:hypothetical protein
MTRQGNIQNSTVSRPLLTWINYQLAPQQTSKIEILKYPRGLYSSKNITFTIPIKEYSPQINAKGRIFINEGSWREVEIPPQLSQSKKVALWTLDKNELNDAIGCVFVFYKESGTNLNCIHVNVSHTHNNNSISLFSKQKFFWQYLSLLEHIEQINLIVQISSNSFLTKSDFSYSHITFKKSY